MSDTLRTRIAAVQRAHRLVTRMVGRKAEKSCLCGWRSPERDCTFTDHPEHVADAVIRELKLKRKDIDDHVAGRLHRYVTDWKTDE